MKAAFWLIPLQTAASWTLVVLRDARRPPCFGSLDPGDIKLAASERFQTWLLEQGVDLLSSGLKLEWTEASGYGLYCTRDVEGGSILVSLPPTLPLTPQVPVPHPPLASLARLALRLLYEKVLCSLPSSGGGRYGPYLAVLPALKEMDLPLLWTQQEVALLSPSPLYEDVVELRDDVESERAAILHTLQRALSHGTTQAGEGGEVRERAVYARLVELLEDSEEWLWARAIVMSRPYYMAPGDEESLQLLPLLDMLNHDDDVDYAVLPGDGVFTNRGCATLHADFRGYTKGQQVMGTYGPLSSATKLYSFGYLDAPFTDPTGAEIPTQGTAFLTFSCMGPYSPEPEQQPLYSEQEGWKAAVLKGLGMKPTGQRFEVATRISVKQEGRWAVEIEDPGAMDQMLRFLRLKHLTLRTAPVNIKGGPEAMGGESGVVESEKGWPAEGMSEEAAEAVWDSLERGLEGEGEERVRREVVEECERQERLAEARLAKVREEVEGPALYTGHTSEGATGQERRGLVRRLLEGEVMALRAIKAHICSI